MRVIYIETDSVWIAIMQKLLKLYDTTPIVISVLDRTQQDIKSTRPDAIFLNLMVGHDESAGLAILSAIKQDPDTRDIPTVAISSDYLERGKDQALRMGAYAYVNKQFVPRDLRALLDSFNK